MTSDVSRPDSVSAALTEILRDDLNIDVTRVTRESRLVDDVGLDSVAFAVGMVAIRPPTSARPSTPPGWPARACRSCPVRSAAPIRSGGRR